MYLHVPVPSSWPVSRRRGRKVAVVPGSAEPDLLLEWGPLDILPDEQGRWVRTTLRADIPPTAKVDVKSDDTEATESGWPVRLVEASILGSDGKLLERRLVAFYAFLEHGATAMFRGLSDQRFADNLEVARELLHAAGPDWSGHVAALTQLWDVAPTGETRRAKAAPEPREPAALPEPKTRLEALARAAGAAEADRDALAKVLADAGAAIGEGGDDIADLELLRGRIHRALGDLDEALAAFERAVDAGASPGTATYSMGLAYAELDQPDKAIEAWQEVADAEPDDVDALYNIGLVHYTSGAFEEALEAWQAAFARAPGDFWIARKVIQAQFALGRYPDAHQTRERLLDIWRNSADPAVQLADEFVFDQFEVDGAEVHASETLRPRDKSSYTIFTFRVEHMPDHDHDHDHDHDQPAKEISVQVETSDYAKQRGVPYVISVIGKNGYKALGTAEKLPPYPELKATVEQLIRKELAGAAPAGAAEPGADGETETE